MQYKIEDLIDDWDEVLRMSELCFDEVDQMKQYDFQFELDYDQYVAMNEAGMLRYYTMYNDNDEKVGFAVFIIGKSLHCKGTFMAQSDGMYIEPEYRGEHFKEFIELIKVDLKSEGVHWFTYTVKSWMDSGKLGKAIDCELYEHTYQGVLN